jgi:hypothetical protein
MSSPHASVSIVCVYNNLAVRQQCLDRSIEALCNEASDVEYLPIENLNSTYPSAGAALNHGVSLAKNEVVTFVHQDVFLHSLTALKQAAGQMTAGGFGVLGANGMRSDGQLIGRIRDRVILQGEPVEQPTDVDSLDEVLFLAPRSQLLSDPLTESRGMAWHAYAVEYGLRMRRQGLRTGVADIPLTHNSLTVNLDRLDEAHQSIAARYPDLLPVQTTCGTVTSKTAEGGGHVWFRSHRWRYRWLIDSIVLQATRRATGRIPGVLADIRQDADEIIDRSPGRRLRIVNCSNDRHFVTDGLDPLELRRRDGTVLFTECSISDISAMLASRSPDSWLLLTNLSQPDLKMLSPQLVKMPSVLGFHAPTGFWLLIGAALTELPPGWRSRKATPLGVRPTVGQKVRPKALVS